MLDMIHIIIHYLKCQAIGVFDCKTSSQKESNIYHAWNLLTRVFTLDPKRIYVTYFGGDTELNIPEDIETKNIWSKYIDETHILPFGMKDNFWMMAENGPCGPCTEIHYDLRDDPTFRDKFVNNDDQLVVEIWNLVFIQYNMKNNKLEKLDKYHVDTGCGFERLVMVLQNKKSSYDTDVFTPIFSIIESVTKVKYCEQNKIDISYRIIADHLRTIIFSLNDDIIPDEHGRGYIITKLIKRSMLYLYLYLNGQRGLFANIGKLMIEYYDVDKKNIMLYVIYNEENKYGNIMWKSVVEFRKLSNVKNMTKNVYDHLTKTRGIYKDVVDQFIIDNNIKLIE
jgi:alanyl-tRNA synthetase